MTNGVRTDRGYEAELQALRSHLLLMVGRVEEMIAQSVRSLLEQDRELARRVVDADDRVNRDELEIDERCLRLLALRQPMASDLRFITFALKMVTDIERIGDHAAGIAERACKIRDLTAEEADAVQVLTGRVRANLALAIAAFRDRDVDKARAVLDADDEIDELYHRLRRAEYARAEGGAYLKDRIRLQRVARLLERIGDHTTNLAEQVIFMVRGKDLRHAGSVKPDGS